MKRLPLLVLGIFFSLVGFSQTATQVTLDGSASTDVDGTISSYSWKQTAGPANPTIVSPTSAVTIVKDFSVVGVYDYQLTVTDNQGAVSTAIAEVTVYAANIPPKAIITVNKIAIQLPAAK